MRIVLSNAFAGRSLFVAGGADSEADRIVVETALANYTRDAAYASFEENVKGTISAGKYADFVVLSRDILAIPATEIREAFVLLTVMGGRETCSSPESRAH